MEVKSSVNMDLCTVNSQHVIELLVYCKYIHYTITQVNSYLRIPDGCGS